MTTTISWQVKLSVKREDLSSFRALTEEMVKHAETEPGVLIYERFISDDGLVYLYERYLDSASALSHLNAFQRIFAKRFSPMIDRKQFIVFGVPDQELKAVLDGFGATYAYPLLAS